VTTYSIPTQVILFEVAKERERQKELIASGVIPFACEEPLTMPGYKLSVLAEEFGEVAKAMLEEGNLREELIQVAAVAVAWAESLS
jgi:hypothetical protein